MATSTTFQVSCDACGAKMSVPEVRAGKSIQCPKCGRKFKAEPPAPKEPAPKAKGKGKAAAHVDDDVSNKGKGKGKGKGNQLKKKDESGGGSKKILIIGGVLVLLVLPLLGLGGYFLFMSDDSSSSGIGSGGGGSGGSATSDYNSSGDSYGSEYGGEGDGSEGTDQQEGKPKEKPIDQNIGRDDVTNRLPNRTQFVAVMDMEQFLVTPIGTNLVDAASGMSRYVANKIGVPAEDIGTYIYAGNYTEDWVFNLFTTRNTVTVKDFESTLRLGQQQKMGKHFHYPVGNFTLFEEVDRLVFDEARKAGVPTTRGMTKTKRDLTLHLIDDKTVVIADKAIMLEFLKENREPEFRTRLIQPKARTKPQPGSGGEGEYDDGSGEYSTPMDPGSAAPGRPGAATLGGAGVSGVAIDGGGGGPTPATPGGGGVSGTPGAAPDQDGEAGGRGSSIAGTTRPNWRTLDPRLKTMLDTLDRGREDSDRVFTFVIDTRDALKQIQAMAQFIPNAPQIPRVRAVGTTLYSLNSRKLIAKAMIEMGSGREARDVTQEIQVKLSDPRAWDGAQSMLVSLANFLNHPISYRDKSPFLSGGSGSGQPGYPGMGGEGYGEDYSGMGGRGQRGSDGTTIIRPSLAPAGGQPGGEGYPGGEGDYGPGGMQPGFPGGRPGFPSGGPGYPGGEEGYPGGGSGQGSGPPKSSLAIYADDVNIFLEVELDWQRIFREEIAPPLRSAIATQKGRMIVRAGGVTWTELATTADPLGKRDEGFPTASYPRRSSEFNLDVPPTKRVSWMRELLPMLGHEGIHRRLDPSRAWDAPSNSTAVEAWIPQFLNPKFPDETWQARPAGLDHSVGATHFVGMAGVGMDAAYYAPGDPRNGIFGHDPARRVKMSDISDGAANTIYMIQVPPVYERPWAHGGATVAGVPKQNSIQPFVSDEYDGKKGTYALMADGTVRFITEEISDEVFKGISTIAGNEGAPILLNDVAPKVKPGEVKQEQVSTGPTDR